LHNSTTIVIFLQTKAKHQVRAQKVQTVKQTSTNLDDKSYGKSYANVHH